MTPLRVALVGCGNIGQAVYAPLLARHQEAELVAVVDPVPANREAVLRRRPTARGLDGVEALLATEEIDAAILTAPSELHELLGAKFVQRGIPVHIEKPLALDAAGAARLQSWETERGRPLINVGFNLRFSPAVEALQAAIVARGGRGRGLLRATFCVPRPGSRGVQGPAGAHELLTDLGSHHLDLVEFLSGDAVDPTSLRTTMAEGSSRLVVQGCTVTGMAFEMLLARGPLEHRLEYLGGEGRVSVDFVRGLSVRRSNRGWPMSILEVAGSCLGSWHPARLVQYLRAPWHEPSYERALNAFFQGVRDGRFAVPSAVGVRVATLVDTALASLAKPVGTR